MRALVQIACRGEFLLALDEDGYLWSMRMNKNSAPLGPWEPVPGPPDGPPFVDTRDRLTRLEDELRAEASANDDLRRRLGELPAIAEDPSAKKVD